MTVTRRQEEVYRQHSFLRSEEERAVLRKTLVFQQAALGDAWEDLWLQVLRSLPRWLLRLVQDSDVGTS